MDAIVGSRSYREYVAFGDRLRAAGFSEDMREGAPMCRWVYGETVLDVMPLDEATLGFSNRWYKAAMDAAIKVRLAEDIEIRVVTAPYFVATKLEAFKGRGRGDLLGSRDLDDLVALVDGRESLCAELRAESAELRTYVRAGIRALLAKSDFLDALPGFLLPDPMSQARITVVLERLQRLSKGV